MNYWAQQWHKPFFILILNLQDQPEGQSPQAFSVQQIYGFNQVFHRRPNIQPWKERSTERKSFGNLSTGQALGGSSLWRKKNNKKKALRTPTETKQKYLVTGSEVRQESLEPVSFFYHANSFQDFF